MLVMGLPWLVTLELVLYAGCFICGIIAAASVTITQGHFAGQCILYGSIHYNTSSHFLTVEISSSPSLCYFVSAISVCVAIYCFSLIFFWIYAGCVDEEVKRGRMWLNVSLGMCGLLMFLLLVSGCIVRIGRDSLCLSALHNVPSISSCEDAQNETWASPYTGNEFYSGLHSSERSVWVSIFFWLLIMAVVMVQRRQVVGENTMWSHAETEPFFRRPARNL
ncbi:transmembrane protein 179B [Electrophorus electricus]|uniref:Transmembrane protein 179B n=1 Tax=Electrophorus electricus TaxID=8005 RepID=A0A4W4EEV7_ELEEL|nr:transmembrane protein 179B [Electrophorus electricus]